MNMWWESLGSLSKFLYIVAISSTVILVLQSLLSLIGLDEDLDGNLVDDFADAGFQFFSIRGIIAFFTLFGWTGAFLSQGNMHPVFVLFIATLAGLAGMAIVGYLFYSMTKLSHNGTLNYQNALGQTAEVYIPIPAKREQKGKITLTIQGRLVEAEAITDEDQLLPTGTVVKVIGILHETILVVKKL